MTVGPADTAAAVVAVGAVAVVDGVVVASVWVVTDEKLVEDEGARISVAAVGTPCGAPQAARTTAAETTSRFASLDEGVVMVGQRPASPEGSNRSGPVCGSWCCNRTSCSLSLVEAGLIPRGYEDLSAEWLEEVVHAEVPVPLSVI